MTLDADIQLRPYCLNQIVELKQRATDFDYLVKEWSQLSFSNDGPRFPRYREKADKDAILEEKFNKLSQQWYKETGLLSFIRQKAVHSSYQQIIGMGKSALPFIFRELEEGKGDWLWALNAIVGEDKAKGVSSFKEAVSTWLKWWRDSGKAKQ